tara:strand:- start:1560 stop:2369 length:810 start_codon:yes stop_codon:yes gene_type:complete
LQIHKNLNLTEFKKHIETNKKAWNKRTPIHIKSNFYNNDAFLKGKNSLKLIETNAIGNVTDKSLLHLQCHFGQDSISFARMGAKVTAVDFSDIAIKQAEKLAKIMNTDVTFIESNILALKLQKEFDIVFSSYGVLGWLPDLDMWANTISTHLKKGGLFLLTEFHPFFELIKDHGHNYFYDPNPDIEIQKGTYTDGGSKLLTETCWWNHSLTNIFSALESNGLKLTHFEEFDYSPFLLDGMIKKEEGKYVLKTRKKNSTPYVFTLKATKK